MDLTTRPQYSTMSMNYIRTPEGHFLCPEPGCGAIKKRQNTMHYHMKKHAGAMTHACEVAGCGAAFIQKSGLDQHRAQKHNDSVAWNCPCCDHASKMKANLIIHIGRKHGSGWIPPLDKSGACSGCSDSTSGCSKTFESATAYYYHAVMCFTAPEEMTDKLALITSSG